MQTQSISKQLEASEPLYQFLAEIVLGEVLGKPVQEPVFEVVETHKEGAVCHFLERKSGLHLVGKFFARRAVDDDGTRDAARAVELMHDEFEKLKTVWALGLNQSPYRIVRPLAVNPELDALLVEEYTEGNPLDVYLKAGFSGDGQSELARRLTQLAHFLAILHQRSQQVAPVDPAEGLDYLHKVMDQLKQAEILGWQDQARLQYLHSEWQQSGHLDGPHQVLVHGDVTPINIVFNQDDLIAIDLERLHPADPARDLGSAVAEIMHAARLQGCEAEDTASLRQEFLNAYMDRQELSEQERHSLATRVDFFTGAMLLRIARNDWLDRDYRLSLVPLAERMLTL